MIRTPRPALHAAAVALALCGLCAAALADDEGPVDDLIAQKVAENEELAKTQKQIDQIDDETDDLLAEWRAVQRRNKALRAYNAQLGTLIAAQQAELDGVRDQIDRVAEISRQMTPLMLRMLDGLAKFVELDLPFLLDERRERIAGLRALMDRADVAESEKFRSLLEAYQIENDYGRTIEAYRGEVQTGEGGANTVDILRIGRLSLMYASLDGQSGGYYDRDEKAWRPVSPEQLRAIRKGLRMARKQAAPDLVRVPVPAPRPGERIDVAEAMKR